MANRPFKITNMKMTKISIKKAELFIVEIRLLISNIQSRLQNGQTFK